MKRHVRCAAVLETESPKRFSLVTATRPYLATFLLGVPPVLLSNESARCFRRGLYTHVYDTVRYLSGATFPSPSENNSTVVNVFVARPVQRDTRDKNVSIFRPTGVTPALDISLQRCQAYETATLSTRTAHYR